MPGRSPHRRSPPPPPLISRHSSPRGRVRSPERHHIEMASSSRGRERRDFRVSGSVRRSRSPGLSKGRSFSPTLKRKASPSREMSRRAKISKSPVRSRGGSDHGPFVPSTEIDTHTVRTVSGFRDREYEGDRERVMPQFNGPEGSVEFDINELKKFTVEIIRKPSGAPEETIINRAITNPEDIVPVRRPGMRPPVSHKQHVPPHQWMNHQENTFPYSGQNEGARPLFRSAEGSASTSKDRSGPPDDYRRIVAIDNSRVPSERRSRERARISPGRYEESRRPYYPERERSPYESRHRSHPREDYVEPREKHRERRSSREDLRRDLDVRRKDDRRYSFDRGSYERESDLRTRINEKRSEPSLRPDDREHLSRRYESERERHGRSHHSPPREKRRAGSGDRHEGTRSSRSETWDREKESGSERRRRPHSREREERGRDRYEHSEHYEESDRNRRVQPYKTDFEPKKFYKHYEEKEFMPPPTRGRGLPSIRRGMPPIRGRIIPPIARGMNRGFRGGMMGGIIRGIPRGPFMGMRGFPPRKSAF